jgi:hypothetical protein
MEELLSTCICVYRIPFEMRSLNNNKKFWNEFLQSMCARAYTYTLSMCQRPTFLPHSNFRSTANPRNSNHYPQILLTVGEIPWAHSPTQCCM